jgi:hypothetical protein
VAMIATFIQAIRLSYRIEARSPQLRNRSGFPRNAMIFNTIFNLNVADDAETQAIRRRMIVLLLANVAGFVLLGIYIASSRQ